MSRMCILNNENCEVAINGLRYSEELKGNVVL